MYRLKPASVKCEERRLWQTTLSSFTRMTGLKVTHRVIDHLSRNLSYQDSLKDVNLTHCGVKVSTTSTVTFKAVNIANFCEFDMLNSLYFTLVKLKDLSIYYRIAVHQ